jgi:hypothetical protein
MSAPALLLLAPWLLAPWLLALWPAAAGAHGEHGPATPLGGGTSVVTVEGYQVELLSEPGPPARGREARIVVNVAAAATALPVSGGKVLVSLAPAGAEHDPRPAPEVAWAGRYAAAFTPARTGPHVLRVLLEELDGRRFVPPLLLEFPVTVERPAGLGGWTWSLLLALGALTAAGLYGITFRSRLTRPAHDGLNLLDIGWVRRLFTAPGFQLALQVPLLVLTGIVVALGLGDVQNGGVNLATKLTWTIWWAGIIFTFVAAGRVWCLACPFGALNEWTARLARPLRRLPKPFRNIWWATGMFAP